MFSERLKTLRKASRMKQSELAEKLSLSQQTISLYEANKRHPDLETLILLANEFHVSTDYLLGRTEHRNILSKEFIHSSNLEELFSLLMDIPGMQIDGHEVENVDRILIREAVNSSLRLSRSLRKDQK
jgi:transcriptional regulator with XRE-family HTH domain